MNNSTDGSCIPQKKVWSLELFSSICVTRWIAVISCCFEHIFILIYYKVIVSTWASSTRPEINGMMAAVITVYVSMECLANTNVTRGQFIMWLCHICGHYKCYNVVVNIH